MRHMSVSKPVFAGVVVLALIPLLLSAGAPESAANKSPLSPAEQVRLDLEKTIAIQSIEDTPLKDVLEYLAKKKDLKFDVDDRAFADNNLKDALQVPVNLPEMKNVKVSEILRRLLKQVPVGVGEATYVILGDTILITTEVFAPYRWMHQRVNVACEKEELASVMKKLAHETGTNVVIDARLAKEGQALITVEMHDLPLDTAVYMLAEMVGLLPVRVDNVLYITTKDNVAAIRCDSDRKLITGPCPLPPYDPQGKVGGMAEQ